MICFISFIFKNVQDGLICFASIVRKQSFYIFKKEHLWLEFVQKSCIVIEHCSTNIFKPKSFSCITKTLAWSSAREQIKFAGLYFKFFS